MAKIVELIESEMCAGDGSKGSPNRIVVELWTKSGKQIASWDPWKNEGWYRPE